MNQIYSGAALTLAIASAEDAGDGIPGTSGKGCLRVVTEEVKGIHSDGKQIDRIKFHN
jgi:hypothetical protein